ncbi:MAG TPA: hypothetical protein ENN74_01655 [Firmicutes bacterium]|nr:hypothetical protein [Bacillota bacterium]
MFTTQRFVEEELDNKAREQSLKITADAGRQANIVTYRTYDSSFKLLGSVTLHFEESFASIVNYAGRDAGESFRYGDATHKLIAEVFQRLHLEGAPEAAEEEAQAAQGESKKKLAQDAFPF